MVASGGEAPGWQMHPSPHPRHVHAAEIGSKNEAVTKVLMRDTKGLSRNVYRSVFGSLLAWFGLNETASSPHVSN